jgi:alpha-L-fucosidase
LKTYEPTIESLSARKVPAWFDAAKFGLFIHWGLYSVPAFAPFGPNPDPRARDMMRMNPYAEWYENTLKFDTSETAGFHAQHYGSAPYAAFQAPFDSAAANLPVADWSDIFRLSGARYVTLVTKHHDGYLLWPSASPNPHRTNWQSKTDIVGKIAEATRAAGLRFGTYYSGGLDWTFNPARVDNFSDMLRSMPYDVGYDDYCMAHYKELIERYAPDYLWNDIGYPRAQSALNLFAHFYNHNPDGIVNDRWMAAQDLLSGEEDQWRTKYKSILGFLAQHRMPPPGHCDVITPEYADGAQHFDQKWETTRGIGFSFGYNARETEPHLLSAQAIIHFLIKTVAQGGNLLLNIGPRGDGSLCPLQVERLRAVGAWLETHGEAIYGTQPWKIMQNCIRNDRQIYFTANDQAVYALVLDGSDKPISLGDIPALAGQSGVRIGHPGSFAQVFQYARRA